MPADAPDLFARAAAPASPGRSLPPDLDKDALAEAALDYLTNNTFPGMALAKFRMMRLLGVGAPAYLDEQEAKWTRHAAEQQASKGPGADAASHACGARLSRTTNITSNEKA